MFAKRPRSLARRRSTSRCAAPARSKPMASEYRLDPDHIVRVGPTVKRKVVLGPTAFACSRSAATPGEAYDTGGTL